MYQRRAPVLLALFVLPGCGQQVDSSAGPPAGQISAPELAVSATDEMRNLESIMQAFAAEAGVAARLLPRGDDESADLHAGGSIAELWSLAEADRFRPVADGGAVPGLRGAGIDPEQRWVPIGYRPILVAYDGRRVSNADLAGLDDYDGLGDETWRGRLCLTSSGRPGNLLLIAHLIRRTDIRLAELAVRRWVANLASAPYGDDDALLANLGTGGCDIAIVDGAAIARRPPQTGLAIHWFAAEDMLVDVSGIGIGRHAPAPDNAARLVAWLLEPGPNAFYAAELGEIPVNAEADLLPRTRAWRDRVGTATRLRDVVFLLEDALPLAERAGYR